MSAVRKFVPTHRAVEVISQYGTRPDLRQRIEVRESKLFYIDKHGTKFNKHSGSVAPYDAWSRTHLDISTLKVLP